ncbi:MAG: hypothetical protein CMP39_07835 [Rickettsiales bacterium]|nr:hypothetical protein [Rickettsiales bacterium]|tara:strand:+ start:3597 stop:4280 length:684 start_codon:yes stop_codon:yes gene_type:complete
MITYLTSKIGQKQLIAISGIALVLFLIAHVLGNFNMFIGPEAMNDYAYKLKSLGGGSLLWIARAGLLTMFFIHFGLVFYLVIGNIKARGSSYAKPLHKKTRSLFTKFMKLSGVIIFLYIILHLVDYTFTPHTELNSTIDGHYLGLYGHVYNSFLNPVRTVWYILAMVSIAMHLVHGVQSVVQTFGFYHEVYTPIINKITWGVALFIAVGFSSVPIYVLFHHYNNWSI